jgi:hypothetical protein
MYGHVNVKYKLYYNWWLTFLYKYVLAEYGSYQSQTRL